MVVTNKYNDRCGQRAQVVADRTSNSGGQTSVASQGNQYNSQNNGALTLRFSDGAYQEMFPAGVSMSADQTTPVWPPPESD